MLSWTPKGAVPSPSVVQIRMTGQTTGLVSVGVPQPTRNLTLPEYRQNLSFFCGGRGNRAQSVDRLVLSGLNDTTPIPQMMDWAMTAGITHITLHVSAPLAGHLGTDLNSANAVAMTMVEPADAKALSFIPSSVHTVVVLEVTKGSRWSTNGLIDALVDSPVGMVVITWPLTGARSEEVSDELMELVGAAYGRLQSAGRRVSVKGIPVCIASFAQSVGSKSTNRWYVDSDNQMDDSILFFPNVVQFSKPESCRFCAITDSCDGVPERWASLATMRACTPIERLNSHDQ